MSQKKAEKTRCSELEFDEETNSQLTQILDNISERLQTSEPQTPPDPIEQDQHLKFTSPHKIYTYKMHRHSVRDLVKQEQSSLDNILEYISMLSYGSKIRDYAQKNNLKEQDAREEVRNILIIKLQNLGLNHVKKQHYPLPREIKHIIRMDFYGTVRKSDPNGPLNKRTSEVYNHCNPEATKNLTPKDYDLSQSPTWMVYRQFKSFRLLEKIVVNKLIKLGFTPQQCKHFNAYDYSDILFKHFATKKKHADTEEHNASIFLGARHRFVKKFIKKHEAKFRNHLNITGVDKRYSDILIHNMLTKGITANVEVIDPTYSKKQIKILKKQGVIPAHIKIGDKITDEHIKSIRAANLLDEILTRDKSGMPISGPALSVHHKIAVTDSGERTNFSEVNLFKNLCLVVGEYHTVAHCLDKTISSNGSEAYVSRIELDPDLIFFGGFNPSFQIHHHFKEQQNINSAEIILKNYQEQEKNPNRNIDTSVSEKKKLPKGSNRRRKKMLKISEHQNKKALNRNVLERNSRPVAEKPIKPSSETTIITKLHPRTLPNPQKIKQKLMPSSPKTIRQDKMDEQAKLELRAITEAQKKKYFALRAAKKAAQIAIREATIIDGARNQAVAKQGLGNIINSMLQYKQNQK